MTAKHMTINKLIIQRKYMIYNCLNTFSTQIYMGVKKDPTGVLI